MTAKALTRGFVATTTVATLVGGTLLAVHYLSWQTRVIEAEQAQIVALKWPADRPLTVDLSILYPEDGAEPPSVCRATGGSTPKEIAELCAKGGKVESSRESEVCDVSKGKGLRCDSFRLEFAPGTAHGTLAQIRGGRKEGPTDARTRFMIVEAAVGRDTLKADAGDLDDGPHARLAVDAERRVWIDFGAAPGVVRRLGNLSEPLAKILSQYNVTLNNTIIYILAFGLVCTVIAFSGLELGLSESRFVDKEWASAVFRIREALLDNRSEWIDKRSKLVDLTMARDPTDKAEVKVVLRDCLVDFEASGRPPAESVDLHLETLEDRVNTNYYADFLSLASSVCPALGFLGTVLGMTAAFAAMDGFRLTGDAGFSIAMESALITTALGLTGKVSAAVLLQIADHHTAARLERVRALALAWCDAYARTLQMEFANQQTAAGVPTARGASNGGPVASTAGMI